MKYYDLSHYAQEAISKFGGLSSMTALDSVILATIEMDIPQVRIENSFTTMRTFPESIINLYELC